MAYCWRWAVLGVQRFFHCGFKNSSVGPEAASGGISRKSSEQRSTFGGGGRRRARSRDGIWAGMSLCSRGVLPSGCLPCPGSSCSLTRYREVLCTSCFSQLCGVGQALHSVLPQISELKATKPHLLLPLQCGNGMLEVCNWKLACGVSVCSSAAFCPAVAEQGIPLSWFLCSWPSSISTIPMGVFRH